MKDFSSGAHRDTKEGKGRYDLLPPRAIKAIAKHFQTGGSHYGDRNWEKGIPLSSFIDSGLRHTFDFIEGGEQTQLIAATWNLLCALETILRIKGGILPEELLDLS